jgi:hypothetical protein
MLKVEAPTLGIIALSLLVTVAPSAGCGRDGAARRTAAPAEAGAPLDAAASARAASPAGRGPVNDGGPADAAPADAVAPPPAPATPPDLADGSPCLEPTDVALFVSPRRPQADHDLRIMIVSDEDIPGAALWARSPTGEVTRVEVRRFHGPPHAWSAVVVRPTAGTWRIALSTAERVHTCEDVTMRTVRPDRRVRDNVWPVQYTWDRSFENLYSAWIMQLFESSPDERPSWRPLHEVLRDPERNWLYNRLGLGEDGPDEDDAVSATPDCADTPYWLRAYFAWKMRLLFTFSGCTRSNLEPPTDALVAAGLLERDASPTEASGWVSEVAAFDEFMNRVVVSTVQSGAGRLMPDDEESDLYPIDLSRESIRPGTVFVDPYGHLLVVTQWIDQTDERAGMLFAIDGHPDLSIGRKRFWRGAFLFVDDLSWGAGGFKAFRPAFLRGDDQIHRLTNAQIDAHADYGNFSDEQYQLGTDGFYERMDRVLNPRPLDPEAAMRSTLEAFRELVEERIDSVRAGEDYMASRSFAMIEMPDGPEIFETAGAWEDYSTPARDLRLLIAIDLVTSYPDRVVANPAAFSFSRAESPTAIAEGMRRDAREYLAGHHVSYRRSDGAEERLSLHDVVGRQADLEMAYNPNDCVEIRWGAPDGSAERSHCRRHAPAEQMTRMRAYRTWFHTRSPRR